MNPIVFPGLGLEFHIPRVAFSVFGKEIYWYGILIMLGFVLAYLYAARYCTRFGIRKDDVLDFILCAAPGGIIGARIYYVLFYLSIYRNPDGSFNWREAVAIWDGGLAIYGGVIAGILILLAVCKVKKLRFLAFADLAVHGLFIGQTLGRWGNFCNQEAYGGPTTLPWRMGLTVGGTYIEVHPTFLYESLWNLAGLAIVHFFLRKRRKFDGEIFLFYLAWYGLGRVWIEGLRTDSLYLFGTGIRVSQLLAGLSFVIAGGLLVFLLLRLKPDPERLYVNQVKHMEETPQEETSEDKKEGEQDGGSSD